MKDMIYLEGIEEGRIYYIRSKDKRQYSVLVQPEAMEIIERHRGKKYLLNTLDKYDDYRNATSIINKRLKDIAQLEDCKISKKITTYYARHSWATIASRIGISWDTIRYALGHAGGSVTDIYIDYDLEQVDEANRKVIDFIKK
ncbi:MAG: tyrosine-type recombinase/integrase [Bacteroidota bacterium]|nr:tyrosine-type recombinase/integrase [Bacteroidota bacterium]